MEHVKRSIARLLILEFLEKEAHDPVTGGIVGGVLERLKKVFQPVIPELKTDDTLLSFLSFLDELAFEADREYSIACSCMKNNLRARAFDHICSAIDMNPASSEYLATRASIFYANSDFDEAVSDCEAALKMNPRCVKASCILAACKLRSGNKEAAEAVITDALKRSCVDPILLNNLEAIRSGAPPPKVDDTKVALEHECTVRQRIACYMSMRPGVRKAAPVTTEDPVARIVAACKEPSTEEATNK